MPRGTEEVDPLREEVANAFNREVPKSGPNELFGKLNLPVIVVHDSEKVGEESRPPQPEK